MPDPFPPSAGMGTARILLSTFLGFYLFTIVLLVLPWRDLNFFPILLTNDNKFWEAIFFYSVPLLGLASLKVFFLHHPPLPIVWPVWKSSIGSPMVWPVWMFFLRLPLSIPIFFSTFQVAPDFFYFFLIINLKTNDKCNIMSLWTLCLSSISNLRNKDIYDQIINAVLIFY